MTTAIYSCGTAGTRFIETKEKASKAKLAGVVFSILHGAGLLKPGVKAKDIEAGCVSDIDKDGKPEVDWTAFSEILVREDAQPAFGAKDSLDKARDALLADPRLEAYIEDISPEAGAGEARFLDRKVKADVQMSFSPSTTIAKVAKKMQDVYDRGSVEALNDYLSVYLRMFFIHSDKAYVPSPCDVSADVSESTAPADFRTSHINDRPQAVIDCDIFSKIGFLILSEIDNGAAFEPKIILLESAPSTPPHVILTYKERSSGRIFVLDNSIVCEMKDGETYLDWVRGYRPSRITEYGSIEDFDRRENGSVVYGPR
jgi:hypothetical protein